MLAIAVVLVACDPFVASRPGTIVDPEVSGLTTSASPIVDGSSTVTVDGTQLQFDLEGRNVARLYGDAALNGVVLYGTQPRPWYVGTSPPDDGCYLVSGARAFDDPDAVILVYSQLDGVGIRIPKAPGFDPGTQLSHYGPTKGQYISTGLPGFCLDAHGRMARALGGPPPPISSP